MARDRRARAPSGARPRPRSSGRSSLLPSNVATTPARPAESSDASSSDAASTGSSTSVQPARHAAVTRESAAMRRPSMRMRPPRAASAPRTWRGVQRPCRHARSSTRPGRGRGRVASRPPVEDASGARPGERGSPRRPPPSPPVDAPARGGGAGDPQRAGHASAGPRRRVHARGSGRSSSVTASVEPSYVPRTRGAVPPSASPAAFASFAPAPSVRV